VDVIVIIIAVENYGSDCNLIDFNPCLVWSCS